MSYKIEKDLTTVNKGKKGVNTPEWIIFHFVGASGQAKANAKYFKSQYRGASAHYFVDPNHIIQVVEDDTPAWHIGDGSRSRKGTHNGYVKNGGATNTNSIGIELCQDTSTGKDVWNWDFHPETLNKAEWLIKQLQKKYNIDDAHVIRHFDATGKNCPGNWTNADWNNFKKRLEKGIKQTTPKSKPKNDGKRDDRSMYLVQPGDTLSTIATEFDTTVNNLVDWNNLDDPNLIFPETRLVVKGTTSKPKSTPSTKGIDTLAREVIDGKWGSGDERKRRLGSRYRDVQNRVNEILSGGKSGKANRVQNTGLETLARRTIAGEFGHGDERKKRLGSRYNAVQRRVNEILNGGRKTTRTARKSLNTLVNEVLAGKHGSGEARKKSLGSRYDEVQREVNRRLK